MGQNRTIRLEIELKLDDGPNRLTKPSEKLTSIADATADAAVTAYHTTEATPVISLVNVRSVYFHEQAAGSKSYDPVDEEDADDSATDDS